jgi:hypothetical protein
MLVKDRDGRQRMVESRADGSRAIWYRVISAQVTSSK